MVDSEKKFLNFIDKNINKILIAVVLVFSLGLRFAARDFESRDYVVFLHEWYNIIKELGGLKSLSYQIGDYNIVYQTIIGLFTYTSINPLYLYKGLSVIFDYILAFSAGALAMDLAENRKKEYFWITSLLVLYIPTVVMNSAVWSQCDSIYSSFCILSMLMLRKNKWSLAFVFLGMALAFKLQAILFMPFFGFVYYQRRQFSIVNFLIPFGVLWISSLPAVLSGRGILTCFEIYLNQTGEYGYLALNFPNFWTSFLYGGVNAYGTLKVYALALAFSVLLLGFYFMRHAGTDYIDSHSFITSVVWCLWTCFMLIPGMHDRYAYALEILMIVMSVLYGGRIVICTAIQIMSSVFAYSIFLFSMPVNLYPIALINFASYLFFSYTCLQMLRGKTDSQIINKEAL